MNPHTITSFQLPVRAACCCTTREGFPCPIEADRDRDGVAYCHVHDPLGKYRQNVKAGRHAPKPTPSVPTERVTAPRAPFAGVDVHGGRAKLRSAKKKRARFQAMKVRQRDQELTEWVSRKARQLQSSHGLKPLAAWNTAEKMCEQQERSLRVLRFGTLGLNPADKAKLSTLNDQVGRSTMDQHDELARLGVPRSKSVTWTAYRASKEIQARSARKSA